MYNEPRRFSPMQERQQQNGFTVQNSQGKEKSLCIRRNIYIYYSFRVGEEISPVLKIQEKGFSFFPGISQEQRGC